MLSLGSKSTHGPSRRRGRVTDAGTARTKCLPRILGSLARLDRIVHPVFIKTEKNNRRDLLSCGGVGAMNRWRSATKQAIELTSTI